MCFNFNDGKIGGMPNLAKCESNDSDLNEATYLSIRFCKCLYFVFKLFVAANFTFLNFLLPGFFFICLHILFN